MAEDVVRSLGHLALGTRLRRAGERLQADTQELISASGVEVPVVQHTVLAALDRLGPLSIGQLATTLGVRQPGVTRTVGKLEAAGLIVSERPAADRRVKRIWLTLQGVALVEHAKQEVWPRIEAAVLDACSELSGTLLEQLTGLEDALAQRPLSARGSADASA